MPFTSEGHPIMNVSLRSQMTAGVAALGAAVVAVAPITQPDLLPSAERVAAAIQLSAFSNPIIAISDNIFFATQYILDQGFVPDNILWPDTFYGEILYAPQNNGLIPDLVNQFSTGPLSGLVDNQGGYGFASINSALSLVNGVADSAFNAPFAVVEAVQELIAGDPDAALQALLTGIVEPLQFAVENALFAVEYIVENVIENLLTVASFTIPFMVEGLVGATVANTTLVLESLVDTATSFAGNLAALNIEGAWNDIVDGILGSDGTLGQIVELNIGIGLGDFVEEDVFDMENPSIRSVLTSGFQRLGGFQSTGDGGITNDPLFGQEAEAAAAVTESAPAVAELQAAEPVPAAVQEPVPAAVPQQSEAPAAVQEPSEAPTAPSVSEVKSRVSADSAVSTGTSIETDYSTGAGTASDTGATAPDAATDTVATAPDAATDTGATAPDTAGPTGATAGDSGSLNESSAPKESSPRVSRTAAAAAGDAG